MNTKSVGYTALTAIIVKQFLWTMWKDIEIQIKEYIKAVTNGNKETSFGINRIDNEHTFSVENFLLFHQAKKDARLDLLEQLEGLRNGKLDTEKQTTFSNLTLTISL